MRRFNIAYTIGGVALAALSLSGCVSRTENLDNLNVITKPYSLMFADVQGTIYSTYDGQRFDVIPNAQGVPMMGLASTGNYILLRPNPFALFVDDGGEGINRNFNPAYDKVNPSSFGPSFVLNLPGYNDTGAKAKDRLYVASSEGLAYSDSNAQTKTSFFQVSDTSFNGVGTTSLTQLDDKRLIAFDDVTRRVWIKNDLNSPWISQAGIGLPGAGSGKMFIISQKNDIYAVMTENTTDIGVWRSTDQGHNFAKLPSDGLTPDISCAISAFDKVLIVGTTANGIWRFSGQGSWQQSSIGLKTGIKIYGLAAKSNKFKGNKAGEFKSGEYIYAATNDGVYRSDNLGQNWVRVEAPPTEKEINLIY